MGARLLDTCVLLVLAGWGVGIGGVSGFPRVGVIVGSRFGSCNICDAVFIAVDYVK